jgi:Tfp pilus assembly PilM family ATPase
MARRVIGLDLGAYSVKMVRLEIGMQEPKYDTLDAIEEVLVADPENPEAALEDLQKRALQNIIAAGSMEAEMYISGLSSHDGNMRKMSVPFDDSRKIGQVLPGLLESEVPFDLEEMVISWHQSNVLAPTLKDEGSVSPISVAFGRKLAVSSLLQVLQPLNIDPRQLHLASAAPYELARELGLGRFLVAPAADTTDPNAPKHLGAIIDIGHTSTNICLIDQHGLVVSKSILRGGKKLSEEIARELNLAFLSAQELKHSQVNFAEIPASPEGKKATDLAKAFFEKIFDEIMRLFITCKTDGYGVVSSVVLIGGSVRIPGFEAWVAGLKKVYPYSVTSLSAIGALSPIRPEMALAWAYALSCLHPHAKEGRFNFRKDEFAWRGGLDFVKAKSAPLILWGLTLACATILMWSASSLVLDKENKLMEDKLKKTCETILGSKSVPPKKCLALMKEQTQASLGIPQYSAADFYVDLGTLPTTLEVVVSEMDFSENRVRITGETPTFEKVDEIVASVGKINCVTKAEKQGRTTQLDKGGVKFQMSAEIECTKLATEAKPANERKNVETL